MAAALCIKTCYYSAGGIYHEKGRPYEIDEKLYADNDLLKYFTLANQLPSVQAEKVEAAAEVEGQSRRSRAH